MIRLLALLAVLILHAAAGPPPNIPFAIADDWGAHAGAYGTPRIKTPSFDRVARVHRHRAQLHRIDRIRPANS